MPTQRNKLMNILHINLEKMSYIQLQNIRKLLQSYKHNMTYWAAKPTNLFVELDKEMYWFCLDANEQKKTKEKITAYCVNDEAKQLLSTETTFNETMNQIRMEYNKNENNMSSHMMLKLEISLGFDKKYFARNHFRFVIFSLFYFVS